MDVDAMLTRLVGKLPTKLQPVAKALVPSVGAVVVAGAESAATGRFDGSELLTLGVGAAVALVTWAVPNLTPAQRKVAVEVAQDVAEVAQAAADAGKAQPASAS